MPMWLSLVWFSARMGHRGSRQREKSLNLLWAAGWPHLGRNVAGQIAGCAGWRSARFSDYTGGAGVPLTMIKETLTSGFLWYAKPIG
jgi:hypothetical protein